MNATEIAIVSVISELYCAGRTEDGAEYSAEMYMVAAEFHDGRRIVHNATFPGCEVTKDDEGFPCFHDVRKAAESEANKLALRISQALQAGHILKPEHWRDFRPVYGSAAYDAANVGKTRKQLSE